MIVVTVHYSELSLNNLSSRLMVLLACTNLIFSFTTLFLILFVLNPSSNASFIGWQGQGAKVGSQNRAAARGIASIIQTDLRSKRPNCWFNLTASRYLQPAKLKSIFS